MKKDVIDGGIVLYVKLINMNINVNKTFFFLFFVLLGGNVFSQMLPSEVMSIPHFPNCDTSIIRHWNQKAVVQYNYSFASGGKFILSNVGGVNTPYFNTRSGITDMEIMGDTLFYCGVDSGSGHAYIGYFNVNDLTSTSVSENFIDIPYPWIDSLLTKLRPRRLEVFQVEDGIHIVVIGDLIYQSDSVKRVAVDVMHYYPSDMWWYELGAYSWNERDNIFYPDDIAVTENYIALVGHKRFSSGIYIRKLEKPTSALQPIFNTSPINHYLHAYHTSGNDFNVLGDSYGEHPVWCTSTHEDVIAIACMSGYMDGSNINYYGSSVKWVDLSTAPMVTTGEMFYFQSTTYNGYWTVRDIRFDGLNNNILLLHDIENPSNSTPESAVSVISNTMFPNMTTYYSNTKIQQHSMDKFNFQDFNIVSCGRDAITTETSVCYLRPTVSTCFSSYEPNLMHNTTFFEPFYVPVLEKTFQLGCIVKIIPVLSEKANIICTE